VVISRTPYRVSFFGGGTDYPAWYLKEGGAVLSTTIDKYCYITSRVLPPFFNIRHRIVWSHIETVSSISEILHPAVRAGLRYLGFDDSVGLEIHHLGDLPARTGMGSSSSFVVGLIKAMLAMRGGEEIGKHALAMRALELEQRVLMEPVGSQDQVAAAYGGFNCIQFDRSGEVRVHPVHLPAARHEELEAALSLFFLGTSRMSSDIATKVVASFDSRQDALRRMRGTVDEALDILAGSGSLDGFGRLLHEGWMLKRSLASDVTSAFIDRVYEQAIQAGALGGKLLGAGGTGFMIFYAPPDKQPAVRRALAHLLHVPFRFENEGSSLVYCVPEMAPADGCLPALASPSGPA
jgi:D-glycero-alpha-D-manno-heptose-7-phosphate kinase